MSKSDCLTSGVLAGIRVRVPKVGVGVLATVLRQGGGGAGGGRGWREQTHPAAHFIKLYRLAL